MKKDLQNKIFEKYPEFFNLKQSPSRPFHAIVFGLECGDGWYDLINMLCNNIQHHIKYQVEKTPIDICQIKEKFGGLRFYYDGGDDYIEGLVCFAEDMSYKTCEYCGTNQNIGLTNGWLVTCCSDCHKKECPDRSWKKR